MLSLRKYENKFKRIWHIISFNSNIKIKDIENNFDLPWTFKELSQDLNLTIKFIKKYADRLNWNYVSENKNMTLNIIKTNPYLP